MKPCGHAWSGSSVGHSLLELMLSLALGSVLLLGILVLWSSTRSSLASHQAALDSQWQAQRALDFISRQLRMAGYQPQPWLGAPLDALLPESSNSETGQDQLAMQRQSRTDCHGKPLDAQDRNRSGLLQMRFSVDPASRRLHWRCSWQPDGDTSVLQVNNHTLADQVEGMAVLYGEDSNDDGLADAWLTAGAWQDIRHVRQLRLALLVAERRAGLATGGALSLLDESHGPWVDRFPRRVFEALVGLRNAPQAL